MWPAFRQTLSKIQLKPNENRRRKARLALDKICGVAISLRAKVQLGQEGLGGKAKPLDLR